MQWYLLALAVPLGIFKELFFTLFSVMVYYRILNIVPIAAQQALAVYLSFICQSASAEPKLPECPSSTRQPQVCSLRLDPEVITLGLCFMFVSSLLTSSGTLLVQLQVLGPLAMSH